MEDMKKRRKSIIYKNDKYSALRCSIYHSFESKVLEYNRG